MYKGITIYRPLDGLRNAGVYVTNIAEVLTENSL